MISNLLHNFVNSVGNLLQGTFGSLFSTSSGTLESTLPTATYGAATSTTLEGTQDLSNDREILGSVMITTGSALSSAVGDVPHVDASTLQAQAYVESMSDEELEEFIIKLEGVNVLEYDNNQVLVKSINNVKKN